MAIRTFSDLDWKGWFTFASVICSFLLMIFDVTTPDMVMCFEVLLFLATGILTLKEALEGFSSSGVWSPAVMFMVAQGLSNTGGLDYLIGKILGKPKDVTVGQIRMMLIVLVFSSFVSDTAVTAIMIPVVLAYCQKARLPVKQFMSILGYAALTGGTNTVIGTSTNLVISGMMADRYQKLESSSYRDDYGGLPPFSITPYGIQASAWLVVACVLLSPILLTDGEGMSKWINYFRKASVTSSWKRHQQFAVPLRVTSNSPLCEMQMGVAGLLDLNFLFPIDVRTASGTAKPVGFDTVLRAGDVVVFTGDLTKLGNLVLEWNLVPEVPAGLSAAAGLQQPGGDGLACEQLGAGGVTTHPSVISKDVAASRPTQAEFSALADQAADSALHVRSIGGGPINRGPPVLFVAVVAGEVLAGPRSGCVPAAGKTLKEAGFERVKAVPLAVSRPVAMPESKPKRGCCGKGKADYLGGPAHAVLPPEGGSLADIVLQAGDRILLQVAQSFWQDDVVGPALVSSRHVRYSGIITEFSVPMTIEGQMGKRLLSGLSVKSAGFKGMAGAHLVGLQHPGLAAPLAAISEEEKLESGDVLMMAATAQGAFGLTKNPGLRFLSASSRIRDAVVDRNMVQVALGPASPLIGRTAADVRFTETFQALLIGLHRQGARIIGDINEVPLQAGDVLLLEAGPTFLRSIAPQNPCFSLVHEMEGTQPPRFHHVPIAVCTTVVCFTLYALGYRDIVTMMGLCTAVMLMTRVMSPATARRAIDWKILITIGAALAVSKAMEKTGAAEALAQGLLALAGGNEGGMIAVIYLATCICSQIIMNTPAAAIIFPVAATIADQEGIDIYVMAFAIMLAASAVYTTPFGDNINLMTSGVGDYRVWEFVRFGVGVQLIVSPMTILVLAGYRQKALIATITGIAFGVVVVVPHLLAAMHWAVSKRSRQQRQRAKEERVASVRAFSQSTKVHPDVDA